MSNKRAPKERVTFEMTYKKGQANIRKELLPERLPYFSPGATLVSMEIRRAGTIEIDGEELEFQYIRVLCRPVPQSEVVVNIKEAAR